MKLYPSLFLLPLLLLCGCQEKEQAPSPPAATAEAVLYALDADGSTTTQVQGRSTFTETDGIITMTLELSDMVPGSVHALHLHVGSCAEPGMHWNAGGSEPYCDVPSMGQAWGRPMLGDLGNIQIGADGKGSFRLQTDLWALGDGSPLDITGRTLVVHQNPEDFTMECDPSHTPHPHTNLKIGCGFIELTPVP